MTLTPGFNLLKCVKLCRSVEKLDEYFGTADFAYFSAFLRFRALSSKNKFGTEVALRARGDCDENQRVAKAEVIVLKRFIALITLSFSAAIASQAMAANLTFSPVSTSSSCPGCADGVSSENLSPSPLRSGTPSAIYQLGYDISKILYPSVKSKISLALPSPQAVMIAAAKVAPAPFVFDAAAFRFETPYYSSSTGIVNSPMAPWNTATTIPNVGRLYFDMGATTQSLAVTR